MNVIDKIRLGLIPALAERGSAGHIGRTALMKYLYFLQTIREIPLEYNFSIYSYGPFDSSVLADLSLAESLNIVDVTPVQFAGGYGYRIKPGVRAESAKKNAEQFLARHDGDIEWLFSIFGKFNSAELELTSTIIFVDREFADQKNYGSVSEITARVHEIKAHFTPEQIQGFVDVLVRQGILISIARGSTAFQ